MYQGLFLSPTTVGQAVRGSVYAAALFEALGYESSPHWTSPRTDLIQAIRFSSAEQLIAFVQGVQKASAVDAHVVPEPWDMPGYEHPVIMAAGTFIQGGSLELSADALDLCSCEARCFTGAANDGRSWIIKYRFLIIKLLTLSKSHCTNLIRKNVVSLSNIC